MTIRDKLLALWREIKPGVRFGRDTSGIERWDAEAEGPGYFVDFEGFGVNVMLFFGRTPRRRA